MVKKPKILVVEDDESIRTQMKWALVEDYEVFLAMNAGKAMEVVNTHNPPVVILDLGLPPHPEDTEEGFNLLQGILQNAPTTKVIIVTGNSDKSSALRAISMGAHDFFTKPIDIDELKAILKRVYYVSTLEREYSTLQKRLEGYAFVEIVGTSHIMQEVFSTISKVATTDVPVLITGESGTGKELVARAIHNRSLRADKPFVPINCGSIPETLVESELFGHEKGAFTGAHIRRKGRIDMAEGGTLFLDEVSELSLPMQVKFLRFLQDHKIERVGGREIIEVDVRVIAATNRDMKQLVSEGRFREDLYYRLAVVTIDVPPLRDRGEDIILLAKTFLERFSGEKGRPKSLSKDAIDSIISYNWPGNVRELENRMRRAVVLAEGTSVTARDLGFAPEGHSVVDLNLRRAREELDRRYINMAIMKHNGNISKAAEELGLSRPTLHHLMKKYNIKLERGM